MSLGFGREGGSRNFRFSTLDSEASATVSSEEGHLDPLADALRLHRHGMQRAGFFLRAESFFNVASYLTKLDDHRKWIAYGGTPLHRMSHGEAFIALARNRFSPGSLYLLDEPEAALSATRQLALIALLHDLLEEHSDTQFIIATHSPILLAFPSAQILSFNDGRIKETAYRDTDPYLITRRFLDDPSRVLRELFSDG